VSASRPAALLVLLLATPLAAGELAGVVLPDHVTATGRELVLNGMGLREATVMMVDVYVAGLYLPEKSSDPATILKADTPKQLVMRFVRSVGREKLTDAWTEGFALNAEGQGEAVAAGLAKLNAAMRDVKKDDVIRLTYQPGAGTSVAIGGQEAALIPGEAFQRVLYSIWLGPKPPNAGLREGLLGRSGKSAR
jgi:hypothetical protein